MLLVVSMKVPTGFSGSRLLRGIVPIVSDLLPALLTNNPAALCQWVVLAFKFLAFFVFSVPLWVTLFLLEDKS